MPKRNRPFDPETAAADQLALYRTIVARVEATRAAAPAMKGLLRDDGQLDGPPQLWLLSPGFGTIFNTIALALQTELALSGRAREIAILITAERAGSAFEIHAHRPAGRKVGLSEAEIEALCRGAPLAFADPVEEEVAVLSRMMFDEETLDDATYDHALPVLGERGIFEVAVVVGFYRMVALQLASFRVAPE
jgi:alkylhydroperoxidase family enzyme